jgi:hypothetical protein
MLPAAAAAERAKEDSVFKKIPFMPPDAARAALRALAVERHRFVLSPNSAPPRPSAPASPRRRCRAASLRDSRRGGR